MLNLQHTQSYNLHNENFSSETSPNKAVTHYISLIWQLKERFWYESKFRFLILYNEIFAFIAALKELVLFS